MAVKIFLLVMALCMASGVVAAGCWFATLQRRLPRQRKLGFCGDRQAAIVFLIGGLASLASIPRANGWLWPWSRKAKIEAGILLHKKRVCMDGSYVICDLHEVADYTVDQGDYVITDVYLTPSEFAALPEFTGF